MALTILKGIYSEKLIHSLQTIRDMVYILHWRYIISEMSLIRPKTYPREIVETIVRLYNLVSPVDSMNLAGMKLHFTLPKKEWGEDLKVMTWLYEKLAKALMSIQKKYLPQMNHSKYNLFLLDLEDKEDYVQIIISGILYIPPSSLLNLLQMFMWYEIRQQTGTKPKYSPQGRILVERLKQEIKDFKHRIDLMEFNTVRVEDTMVCHFCGEQTSLVNIWNYRLENRLVEIETPVCQKHRMRKI